jgi:hypothetical protein
MINHFPFPVRQLGAIKIGISPIINGLPDNAILYNGEPIQYNGNYLVYN